jgi:ornithine cyclodeaminase
MRFISADEVRVSVDYAEMIEFFRTSHLQPMPLSVRQVLGSPTNDADRYACLSGWKKDGLIVTKLVGIFPDNPNRNPSLPATPGLVLAFDGRTGVPLAIADGAEVTFAKTAADSALGAKLLVSPTATTLLLVGAGNLAPYMARAHLAANRNLRRVLIWNRTSRKADILARRLRDEGMDASPAEDLDNAVRIADVVSCVTMSDTPLVKGELLKEGAHLDLVGAYLPSMREADDAAMLKCSKYVDTVEGALQAGDFHQLIEQEKMLVEDIRADLFALCRTPALGRRSPKELTLFKNNGGGHLDLYAMEFLVGRLARGQGRV